MQDRALFGFLVAAAVGLSACGPTEDAGQAQTGQAAPPAPPSMLEQAKEKAKVATETAVAQGKEATRAAVEMGRQMAEQAKPAIETARQTIAEGSAAAAQAVGEVADAAVEKARELIRQAEDHIAQSKPELAQQAVNKLNVLKDVMPESIQAQIDKLNAMLLGAGAADPAKAQAPLPAALPPKP